MRMKMLPGSVVAVMSFTLLFFVGCDSANRKHFTKLEPVKAEDGNQYFTYKASTGAAGLVCAPGSKNCKTKNARRAPIWPLDSTEAEKIRMQWLEQWLAEEGYANPQYEIISRKPASQGGPLVSASTYNVTYDVRVKLGK